MEELLKTNIKYMIGYFDDGTFWCSSEASTLEKAKELLKTFPTSKKYLILKSTTKFELEVSDSEIT